MSTDRCAHRPGGCPLCDPRPISVDRDAGCVCPAGRPVPLHLDDWQPAPGCPVHRDLDGPVLLEADQVDQLFDGPDLVVELDPLTREIVAGLWGDAFVDEIQTKVAAHARAWLAEHTPGPGTPPDPAPRGEDEQGPAVAGGPGRDLP